MLISATFSIFSFVACVIGPAVASPFPHEPTKIVAHVHNAVTISWPTASGGALDPSPIFTVSPAQISEGPDTMTLEVVNNAGVGVSTTHDRNPGVPAPSGDPHDSGVLGAGSTDRLAIPKGWAGKIAVNKQGAAIVGDESLIEGSFLLQSTAPDPNVPVVAIDVSFVAGFSLPIVCTCPLEGNKYLSGCDKNLWNLGTCPAADYNGNGSCKNPNRDKSSAAPFFQPCQGLAYTFTSDSMADSNGECQSGTVQCTIYPGR